MPVPRQRIREPASRPASAANRIEMAVTRLPARVAAISLFLATLSGVERGVTVYEEQLVEQEELRSDDDDSDHGDWWCVRTDPFPCPASGCSYVADFMTAAHLILVWEQQDDPNLLKHAARALDVGRNPRIVGYQQHYGPSASYYAWIAAGRPVHGVRAQ